MLATLDAFWQKASLYMNLPKISITDIVEIIIIAFLIYYMLVWIKNTRAWMLLRGLMVILLFVLLAALFQMNTIIWIARNTLNVLVIALVVIFQPEMRKALENLGRKNVLAFLFSFDSSKEDTGKFSDKTINEMVKACYEMGKVKTGALIVVEDEIVLSEYERTGIAVDGILTSQLLINIFEKNTPLHDGAVLVLAAGDVKLSNAKFREHFGFKAQMIRGEEVEALVGHAPGGVCPFGVNEGVQIYCDVSLQRFETVYPACGDDQSAVRFTPQELFEASHALGWVDVTVVRE